MGVKVKQKMQKLKQQLLCKSDKPKVTKESKKSFQLTSINTSRQVTTAERATEANWRSVNEIRSHPRLVVRLARVAKSRAKSRQKELCFRRCLRLHKSKEGVMLDASLPETLRRPVVWQLKSERTLILLKLSGANLNVETVSLVANLKNLGPAKTIDAKSVSKDVQSTAADAHHNIKARLFLGRVQVNAVHGQLFSIFKVLQLSFLRSETSMLTVQFGNFLLQFRRLVRSKVKCGKVVSALVVLAHLVVT